MRANCYDVIVLFDKMSGGYLTSEDELSNSVINAVQFGSEETASGYLNNLPSANGFFNLKELRINSARVWL